MGSYFPGGLQGHSLQHEGCSSQYDESAWGRIIYFGSPIALSGKAHMAAYNSTKGTIRSPTLTAAHEMWNLRNHHQLPPSGSFD